jgi:hypothetical protein
VTCGLDIDHIDMMPENLRDVVGSCLYAGCVQVKGSTSGRHKLLFRVDKPFVSILKEREEGWALRCMTAAGDTHQDVILGDRPGGGTFDLDWPDVFTELPKLPAAFQAIVDAGRQVSQYKREASDIVEVVDGQTVSDIRHALRKFNPESRGEWVSVGLALKCLGDTGWELWEEWSAQSDKWRDGQDDPERIWDGFLPIGGMHYKWIFSEAYKRGWKQEFNPAHVDNFQHLLERVKEAPAANSIFLPHKGHKLLPRSWLVHKVMPRRGVAQVFGEPGVGKTYFMLDMMLSASAGRPFGILKTMCPGLSLYLAAEGELASRVRAWELANECPAPDAFRYAHFSRDLSTPEGKEFVLSNLEAAVKATGKKLSVLCIDTLTAAAPGADENTKEGLGPLLGFFRSIAAEYECLVVFVHHCGKDTSRGSRGWSGLKGDVDAEITISRSMQKHAHADWIVSKMRNGVTGVCGTFELLKQPVGRGAELDEMAEANEVVFSAICKIGDIQEP